MAQRKRPRIDIELHYELKPEEVALAFANIGEDARNWLKQEIVFSDDKSRRDMAKEILGWAENRGEESKIKRNVEE